MTLIRPGAKTASETSVIGTISGDRPSAPAAVWSRPASPMTTGRHRSATSGSIRAPTTTSGPTPAPSPMVTAISGVGRAAVVWSALAASVVMVVPSVVPRGAAGWGCEPVRAATISTSEPGPPKLPGRVTTARPSSAVETTAPWWTTDRGRSVRTPTASRTRRGGSPPGGTQSTGPAAGPPRGGRGGAPPGGPPGNPPGVARARAGGLAAGEHQIDRAGCRLDQGERGGDHPGETGGQPAGVGRVELGRGVRPEHQRAVFEGGCDLLRPGGIGDLCDEHRYGEQQLRNAGRTQPRHLVPRHRL